MEKSGDKMFMGQYSHTIDEKNRLIIPSKFRMKLGETFVITKGLEKCLFVYPLDEWKKLTNNLNKLSFTKKNARIFSRLFISSATECELDKQGRIGITSVLTSYAKLEKECVIIGTGDRLEIWSKDSWDSFYESTKDDMESICENIFATNI